MDSKVAPALHSFVKNFRRLVKPFQTRQDWDRHVVRAGIAVSGGADSMALASLCAQARKGRPKYHFIVFVVDHQARTYSAYEADLTKRRLLRMGFKVDILQLEWPGGKAPSDSRNFETEARKLRYQALGRACLRKKLNFLLVAHHGDDVAETVLMRLSRGHTGRALMGIRASGNIPECEGMYGIQSGGPARHQTQSTFTSTDLRVAGLGIQIIRPLLDFGKADLKEVCKSQSVEWEEDDTNRDAWRTDRNAIRKLVQRQKLPQALTKPALLQIVSRINARERLASIRTDQFERTCQVLAFHKESGHLTVRISIDALRPLVIKSNGDLDRAKAQDFAVRVVRRLVEAVSPSGSIRLSALKSPAAKLFSDLFATENDDSEDMSMPDSFCVAGVQCKRMHKLDGSVTLPDGTPAGESAKVWTMQRQNYMAYRGKDAVTQGQAHSSISLPPADINFPPVTAPKAEIWSDWQLWDGRYWIRVANRSLQDNVTLRPLTQSDMTWLKQHQPPERFKRLQEILHRVAPGKARFSIPVLVRSDKSVGDIDTTSETETTVSRTSTPKTFEIIALPSLGAAGHLGITDPDYGWRNPENPMQEIQWDVQYKQFSFAGIIPTDGVDRFGEWPPIGQAYAKQDVTVQQTDQRKYLEAITDLERDGSFAEDAEISAVLADRAYKEARQAERAALPKRRPKVCGSGSWYSRQRKNAGITPYEEGWGRLVQDRLGYQPAKQTVEQSSKQKEPKPERQSPNPWLWSRMASRYGLDIDPPAFDREEIADGAVSSDTTDAKGIDAHGCEKRGKLERIQQWLFRRMLDKYGVDDGPLLHTKESTGYHVVKEETLSGDTGDNRGEEEHERVQRELFHNMLEKYGGLDDDDLFVSDADERISSDADDSIEFDADESQSEISDTDEGIAGDGEEEEGDVHHDTTDPSARGKDRDVT